jgi:UTP--glucose-1-phosphate uridylyltransferase
MDNSRTLSKAVIPVGGLGTRLLPATKVLPKELLPVGRRPIVQYVVEEMRAAGLENICFVTGRKKTLIQEHFDYDPELVRHLQDRGRDELLAELAYLESGLHLQYVRQSGPQGLADALGLVEDFAGKQPFVLALGDSIICESEMGTLLRRMIRAHTENAADVTIACERLPSHRSRGYPRVIPADSAEADAEVFDVGELPERPYSEPGPGDLTIAARYVFGPAIFGAIRRTRAGHAGEVQLTDVIRTLLRKGSRVQAVRLASGQRRHDIGSFGGYFRAFLEFALLDPSYGDDVRAYLQELCEHKDGSNVESQDQE